MQNITVKIGFSMLDDKGNGVDVPPIAFTGLGYKEAVHIQGQALDILNGLYQEAVKKAEKA